MNIIVYNKKTNIILNYQKIKIEIQNSINKFEYVSKMETLLSDTQTYCLTLIDPTTKTKHKFKHIFN